MRIRKKERQGNIATIEAEEDYSGFEQAVEKALGEAGKEIKVAGFRPGRAPREIIERSVDREAIESRAAQNLIGDLYPKILEQSEIDVVDFPKIEILQQEKNKPFVFKIIVEVYPEVKLGKYKGLKIEKKVVEIGEEEVLKFLGSLKGRFAKTGPDGKKEEIPLDDEFAKKASRHGTLAELKEEVREVLQKDAQARSEASLKDKLIALASSEAKADVPSGMINREVDLMLDELCTSLAQNNLTLEDYLKGIKKEEKALREELRKAAEIRVRGKIVLRAIADAEKMKVSKEEMEDELKALSEAGSKSVEETRRSLEEGGRKFIEDYLLRRKALGFLVEKAKIKSASA